MVKAQESKAKGFFFGILAAVSYGVNPLGAKYLYEEGLNVESVCSTGTGWRRLSSG